MRIVITIVTDDGPQATYTKEWDSTRIRIDGGLPQIQKFLEYNEYVVSAPERPGDE